MFCSLEGILFPFRKNKEKNTFFRFFMEHLIKQFFKLYYFQLEYIFIS